MQGIRREQRAGGIVGIGDEHHAGIVADPADMASRSWPKSLAANLDAQCTDRLGCQEINREGVLGE
jgi:hypothetical protein